MPAKEDEQFQVHSLLQVLDAVLPTLAGFVILEALPSIIWHQPRFAFAAFFLTAILIVLYQARRTLKAGAHLVALRTVALALMVLSLGLAALQPNSAIVVSLIPLIAIGIVLPNYRGRPLAIMVALAWLASVACLVMGLFLTEPQTVPLAYTRTVQVLGFGAVLVFVMAILVRQQHHLRVALERSRHALERLQAEDRAKGRFLNTIAHELNTPLTPIKIQLHLLMADRDPKDPAMGGLTALERNVQRLSELIRDATDVTRIDAGAFAVRRVPLDLAAILRQQVEHVQEAARQAQVSLTTTTPAPCWVDGDQARLAQAIGNILANAIKYTASGGRVHAEAVTRLEMAEVVITDTGCGFTAAQKRQLFQPFSQANPEARRSLGGTGSGLYLVRGIVEGHGGTTFASSPGEGLGATFGFRVPSRSAPSKDGSGQGADEPKTAPLESAAPEA